MPRPSTSRRAHILHCRRNPRISTPFCVISRCGRASLYNSTPMSHRATSAERIGFSVRKAPPEPPPRPSVGALDVPARAGADLSFRFLFADLPDQRTDRADGLFPAADYLHAVAAEIHGFDSWYTPTLLWLGLSDRALMPLCWIGDVASILAFLNVWPRATLAHLLRVLPVLHSSRRRTFRAINPTACSSKRDL